MHIEGKGGGGGRKGVVERKAVETKSHTTNQLQKQQKAPTCVETSLIKTHEKYDFILSSSSFLFCLFFFGQAHCTNKFFTDTVQSVWRGTELSGG